MKSEPTENENQDVIINTDGAEDAEVEEESK